MSTCEHGSTASRRMAAWLIAGLILAVALCTPDASVGRLGRALEDPVSLDSVRFGQQAKTP